MLIIQVALGIVLAYIIIKFPYEILMVIFTPIVKIFDFFDDLLKGSARKRNYEESWKRFNEQRQKEKMQKCKDG